MKFSGLDHITVNVKNLEQSEKFYGDLLGLEKTGFIDMGDHTLTYFRLPREVRLELIDYADKAAAGDIKETDTGIYRHFCLVTDQLAELHTLCVKQGIFVRKSPSYVEKLQARTMLITDPNGVEIEIIQRG